MVDIYEGGLGSLSIIGNTASNRLAYLAQRQGVTVDPRTYEGSAGATPSTIEIDVARGRGPYICTQISVSFPAVAGAEAEAHRLDIQRGATSLLDGKLPADTLDRSGFLLNTYFPQALPNLVRRHAPLVLDQDTLSVYAEPYSWGTASTGWELQLSGFHTTPDFAQYVQTKMGEFGASILDMGGLVPRERTLSLSRPLTVSAVVAATPVNTLAMDLNTGIEIRRNTLQLFSRGFNTLLGSGEAAYDLCLASDSLAHSASTNDLYDMRSTFVVPSVNNHLSVVLAGARVYTR